MPGFPKYSIGTRYIPLGKNRVPCTVVDIWQTFNSRGECVRVRYVSEHEFCGQIVCDTDVVETTIDRGEKL